MKKIWGLFLALGLYSTASAATIEVSIDNFAFNPTVVDIQQGDTVRWVNNDSGAHLVQGNFGQSQNLETGQSYEFTFNEAGNFDYICQYHPSMTGTVRVALGAEIVPPSANSGLEDEDNQFADFFEAPPTPESSNSGLEIELPSFNNDSIVNEAPTVFDEAPLGQETGGLLEEDNNNESSINNNPPPTTTITPGGGEGEEATHSAGGHSGGSQQSLSTTGPGSLNWAWVLGAVMLLGVWFGLARR